MNYVCRNNFFYLYSHQDLGRFMGIISKCNNLLLASLLLFVLKLSAVENISLPNEAKDLLTNKSMTISNLSSDKLGNVFLFMSSKCPCSHSHVNLVKELIQKYSHFNFYIVHSNVDENEEQAKNYFSSLDIKAPIIQDDKAKLADLFKAYKTPHAFILNHKNEILYKGGISNSNNALKSDKFHLTEALEDIENQRPIKNPAAKTLGCFISRDKE